MEIDENLASIHAYLCSDGYVIKNPETQKHKYYMLGLRNTNLVLLKDFQDKFEKVFGIKPYLIEGQRCRIGSKTIYELLTREFGSFYSHEWTLPKLDKELSKHWLRSYFDCDGWVFCKKHQNRHIGLDSVNEEGLNQIKKALENLNIKSIIKKRTTRNIFSLSIYGKGYIEEFAKQIGFLHPKKSEKLKETLQDFVVYKWNFPIEENICKEFVLNILKERIRIKKPYYIRIFSREECNLQKLKDSMKKFYDINCLVYKCINGIGTIYYELDINRKEEVKKLINLGIIPNVLK